MSKKKLRKAERRALQDLGYDLNVESIPRQIWHTSQLRPGTSFGEEIGIIWADDANLKAIADFVQRQRPYVHQYPKLLPAIQSFEKWYSSLGWFDVHVMINDTMKEAYRRRNEINEIMNMRLPEDWIPADLDIQNKEPSEVRFRTQPDRPKEPLIPTKYKMGVAVGAGVVGAVALLGVAAKFSPMGIARAVSRRG